jgi:hypothetical protein
MVYQFFTSDHCFDLLDLSGVDFAEMIALRRAKERIGLSE